MFNNLKFEIMEILLFALKTWSIVWTLFLFFGIYALLLKRPKGYDFVFNLKSCVELTLYITSIYSWFV